MGSPNVVASIDLVGPLNGLSLSPSKRLIAVGGRDVLKIIAFNKQGLTEKRNLRVGKTNLSYNTNDIRWNPHLEDLVATAATNGQVIIWNLQRKGLKHSQERVFSAHQRAVNRISWHPAEPNILLSASQDGTLKLWDKRGKTAVTYRPKSESIRDVQFSGFQTSKFALGFENGMVQIWDMRRQDIPEIKFMAHKGLVLALDWHPTKPQTIATASRDRTIQVWDTLNCKHPLHTIQTIASVGRIQWRPNVPNQLASSSSLMDNSIHIWDVKRPCIPLASMTGHSAIASGIQWLDTPISEATSSLQINENSADATGYDFWQHVVACSKDGTLKLHSLAHAFKPHKHIRTSSIGLNPLGTIATSYDKIDRSCKSLQITRHFDLVNPLFTVSSQDMETQSRGAALKNSNQSLTKSPESLFNALSPIISAEGSSASSTPPLAGNFSTKFHMKESSFKSARPLAHLSVASFSKAANGISSSDEIESSKLSQYFGFDHHAFRYFAREYQIFGESFDEMCDYNTNVAFRAGNYKIKQLWVILKLLFQPTNQQSGISHLGKQTTDSKSTFTEASVNASHTASLLQQLDHVNPQAMQGFEESLADNPQLSNQAQKTSASIPNSTESGSTGNAINPFQGGDWRLLERIQDDVLKELLEYYADLGDVQTCVSVVSVVNSLSNVESILGKQWLQKLYMSYIDLLHRLKLYTVASELISHCPDPSIKQMNMKSTTIYSNCSNCSKPLDPSGSPTSSYTCTHCRNMAGACSLCQQSVQGLLVWCPSCSHGGHLQCMKEWFEEHDSCPTGCLHKCAHI